MKYGIINSQKSSVAFPCPYHYVNFVRACLQLLLFYGILCRNKIICDDIYALIFRVEFIARFQLKYAILIEIWQ